MKHHIKPFIFFLVAIIVIPFAALLGADNSNSIPSKPTPNTSQEQTNSSGSQKDPQKQKDQNPKEVTIYLSDTKKTKTLPMNDYIRGVVMAEMPASFEEEALKAQAVIAHTYALRVIANETASPSEDLKGAMISTDSARHQAYLSDEQAKERYGDQYDTYFKKIKACVDSVMNEILTYENEPIIAAFHAISSGNTEAAKNVWGQDVPYLVPCKSEGDPLSPSFENTLTLTSAEVKKILEEKYDDIKFTDDKSKWFELSETTPSGYVSKANVLNKEITGQELRTIFSLKSSNVAISYKDDKYTFTTKGYGHGVGMSQYGADYMARQGKNYQEILMHYYPNTSLTPVSA